MTIALLITVALLAGIFAGLTGAGGGLILVPLLVFMNYSALDAVATSSIAVMIAAIAATVMNSLDHSMPWKRVALLAIPAMLLAPIGALIASKSPEVALLIAFCALNVVNIYLLGRRAKTRKMTAPVTEPQAPRARAGRSLDQGAGGGAQLARRTTSACRRQARGDQRRPAVMPPPASPADLPARALNNLTGKVVATGGSGGLLAGLFGVGGGLIMVPLQVQWLATPIQTAARVSLAVIIFSSAGAIFGHAASGENALYWTTGLILGVGGVVGAPIGARILNRISQRTSTIIFQVTLVAVTISLLVKIAAY